MRSNRNAIFLGYLLASACLAPLAAHASPVVSMDLTGVNGDSLDGIYTDPYYAKVDPTGKDQFNSTGSYSTAIYCDDFADEVQVGQTWQAQVTNLGGLSSSSALPLMFDRGSPAQQVTDYQEAAWLVEQIAWDNHSAGTDELISYAIWGIFDSNAALSRLSWSDQQAATAWQNQAQTGISSLTLSDLSAVSVYTPVDVNGDPESSGRASSQEYLAVSTPEPSTLSLAAVGLVAIGFAMRRRRRPATTT